MIDPMGQARNITGSGAGNATTYATPPTGKRWLVLYGQIKVVCDATVASRTATLEIVDSSNNTITKFSYPTTASTASQTHNFYLMPSTHNQNCSTNGNGQIGLGSGFYLCGGDKLKIAITSGVAGDAMTYSFRVIEMPDY